MSGKTNYNRLNISYTIVPFFKLAIIVVKDGGKVAYSINNNVDLLEKKN